ncbi:MAG TPA: hypothetical protein VFE25_02080 [Opitutaceae bacterium]|jgi:hypothetical protein|nr:hypothetical protein [Opitutaceae bacterium]
MPIRLLSFLNEIEGALAKQCAANMSPMWDASRMVSYHQSLARMVLTTPKNAEVSAPGGTVFLQSFLLSDGSPCLKATVGWEGSAASSVVAVYAKPELDWKAEASRIASIWLAGPPQMKVVPAEAVSPGLAAVAVAG